MTQILFKTKNNTSPQGKPRVYFTCHPDDFEKSFEKTCKDLFDAVDCTVFYAEDMSEKLSDEQYELDIKRMNLVVIPVTFKLLVEDNRAILQDFKYAQKEHIPVLPIMMDHGIDEIYSRKDRFGELQYLDPEGYDGTGKSYEEKLRLYLQSVLVDDETADRIRSAFDAYVFLSYRKKDRKYADELMRLIHEDPVCRDIAIWYDEYLIPGESFNDVIAQAMEKSKLFTLLVTPNLINEENYVHSVEYPEAVKSDKKIVPAEMVDTDRNELQKQYEALPECFDARKEEEFNRGILSAIRELALQNDDPGHNYLIGLAYLEGIDVEVNTERALELITSAGEAELPEAMEKLRDMYSKGSGTKLDYNKAVYWAEKLYNYRKKSLGEKHPDTLLALDYLPLAYRKIGKREKALELAELVYDLRKEILGRAHTDTIVSLHNLADAYSSVKNTEKALTLHEKAYNIRKEMLGENQPDTLVSLHKLANAYNRIGNYVKTLELHGKVYKLRKEVLGENHPDTILSLHNLANAYDKIGNYERALKLKEYIYNRSVNIYGDNHHFTLISLLGLASAYDRLGNYEKALELKAKHFYMYKRVFGENDPNILPPLFNLANAYEKIGNYEKALELQEQIYLLQKEEIGEKHPRSLDFLNTLACMYRDKTANYKKALDLSKKAYELKKEVYGEEDANTLISLSTMASVYNKLGDFDKAIELGERVYTLRKKVLGETNERTMISLNNLAQYYANSGNEGKAAELFNKLVFLKNRTN